MKEMRHGSLRCQLARFAMTMRLSSTISGGPARQMTYALAAPDFDKFVDTKRPKNLFYVAMTQYDKKWPWLQSVIKPDKLEHILAQVFAD